MVKDNSFAILFAQIMSCEKCNFPRENSLHYITQCDYYSDSRLWMLDKIKAFIPNIHILPKKEAVWNFCFLVCKRQCWPQIL